MNSITVDKADLVNKITFNRAKHIEQFRIQVEIYKKLLALYFQDCIETLELGKVPESIYPIDLETKDPIPTPKNHVKEYDQALQMLEWEVGSRVEISATQFQQYINDDWNWMAAFNGTSTYFNSKS